MGSWRRGIFLNQIHAENRVGSFLVTAGFKLFNPCRFVRVEHWDCTGNKTHHPDRVMGFAYSMRRPTALQKAIDTGKVVAPLIGPLAGTPGAVVNPASTHYLAQLEPVAIDKKRGDGRKEAEAAREVRAMPARLASRVER